LQIGVEDFQNGVGGVCEQERVAVAVGVGDRLGTYGSSGTWFVDHDHGLSEDA
jgi:hypothetical protein